MPIRVLGTAVYLTTQRDLVPSALALNLKHNGVLQERLLLLKVTTERAPRVAENTLSLKSCRKASGASNCALASLRSRMSRRRCGAC